MKYVKIQVRADLAGALRLHVWRDGEDRVAGDGESHIGIGVRFQPERDGALEGARQLQADLRRDAVANLTRWVDVLRQIDELDLAEARRVDAEIRKGKKRSCPK